MEKEEQQIRHSNGIQNFYYGGGFHIHVYSSGNQVAQSITNEIHGDVIVGHKPSAASTERHDGNFASMQHGDSKKKATKEMMSHAAKITLDGGYWKSQRSWSVTYIIYMVWGYKGTVNDFLLEANNWPDGVAERIILNRDAVEKLRNKYNFSKDIKEWRSNGVPEPYCILGEQLDNELEKMQNVIVK